MNIEELKVAFSGLKQCYYGDDRRAKELAYVHQNYDVEEFTVAVGGYKIVVKHVGTFLLSAHARAASVQRGHLALDLNTTDNRKGWDIIELHGATYYWDCWSGPAKYHAAMMLLIAAWHNAGGDRDLLYKALGKSGYCAICGATLTDDLSTQRGIGPECWKKIYVNFNDVNRIQRRRVNSKERVIR
jgi:hypothetical protein